MSSLELLLLLLAPMVLLALFLSLFRNPKLFFLILFASKPFIDQSVRVKLTRVSGEDINLLALIGVMVFGAVALFNLVKKNTGEKVAARGVIILFLLLQFFVGAYSYLNDSRGLLSAIEVFIRMSTPFFLYFIAHQFLKDRHFQFQLVRVIWLSHMLASLMSLVVYALNWGYADISQEVQRFSGFYADSATLSLVAFTGLVFGLLFREMYRERLTGFYRSCFLATLFSFLLLTWITLTKATLLIAVVLGVLWFGFYRRRMKLVIALLLIVVPLLFTTEAVQKRFKREIAFLESYTEKSTSITDFRGLGSGRFGRWLDNYDLFVNKYSEWEQLFGTNLFFHTHNQYLATLLQVGLVGLVLFLLILWKLYRAMLLKFRRSRDPFIFMAIVFLTSLVLYGFGYLSFTYTGIMWITMILVSRVNVTDTDRPEAVAYG